ncbi:hypothetical protein [Streptomyces sp. NPDC047042]|uniref:hypothetical protein n=1 Tax=Streptomyces sp. NPDC047042 TaxID=3154807 RepID=UPI0033F5FFA8
MGTDAHHAARVFRRTHLMESFPQAMEYAVQTDAAALVAAGYIDRAGGTAEDTWVDLHFRYLGKLTLRHVWSAATKPMCVAVNPDRVETLSDVRSIALHPATKTFADALSPDSHRVYVEAKPKAVALAEDGATDACIGSVDVVDGTRLKIMKRFNPSMVWCLYTRAES